MICPSTICVPIHQLPIDILGFRSLPDGLYQVYTGHERLSDEFGMVILCGKPGNPYFGLRMFVCTHRHRDLNFAMNI